MLFRSSRGDPPSVPTTPPRDSRTNNHDIQTLSYEHGSQAQNVAAGDTPDDRSLSCVVNIAINSGFDRSQNIRDNAPVAAYTDAMAAVASSSRSRRAQLRSAPFRQIPPHLSPSDNESGPSEDGHEDGDASGNEGGESV